METLDLLKQQMQVQISGVSDVDEGQNTSLAHIQITDTLKISFSKFGETSNRGNQNSDKDTQRGERSDSRWKASQRNALESVRTLR